jgi:hypothetical protein
MGAAGREKTVGEGRINKEDEERRWAAAAGQKP